MPLDHSVKSKELTHKPNTPKGRPVAKKKQRVAAEIRTPSSQIARLYFGPPLLPGENKADYYKMLDLVNEALSSNDVFEKLYAKEITDASLEIERLKHMANEIVRARWFSSLADHIVEWTKRYGKEITFRDALQLVRRDHAQGVDCFKMLVARYELTVDENLAKAYYNALDITERFNALIALAEKRRRKAIREVELYQARKKARARVLPLTLELQAETTESKDRPAS